jgi:hypothetical protein
MKLQMDLNKTKAQGQLFKTSLEKSLFSSPAACIKSIDARLSKLRKKYGDDEIKDIFILQPRHRETINDAICRMLASEWGNHFSIL